MTETTPSSKTRPPKQSRTGLKANGTRKAASKSNRSRAREFALQGLYQWLLSQAEGAEIEAQLSEHDGFDRIDRRHFDALLYGCIREAGELDALLARHVDRRISLLSPVEHAVLLIGAYAWLTWRAFAIGREARRLEQPFAALVAQGIGTLFGIQSLINIAVNMGFAPTKGLTLPLMSYGGSGMIASLVTLSVLLRIDWENRRLERGFKV